MADIRKAFLDLRGQVRAGQRPFKFHYHRITSFENPDRHWDIGSKRGFRKCKHVLVALDEPGEPTSQAVYRKQVTTFVGHLLNVVNDTTFPIWLYSVNEPPSRATNCYKPYMRRTTDHPCNDVLKDLCRPGATSFPSQVHFLDNTDVTNPQFNGENRADVLAVVAMRTFVIIAKGVADWRTIGQHGAIDGLHRNGTVEPNFELVPYEGW